MTIGIAKIRADRNEGKIEAIRTPSGLGSRSASRRKSVVFEILLAGQVSNIWLL